MVRAPWSALFDALVSSATGFERRLAYVLAHRIPFHSRKRIITGLPDAEALRPLVDAVRSGRVRVEALPRMIDQVVAGGKPAADVIERHAMPGDETIDGVVAAVEEQVGELRGRSAETLGRWAMGIAMARLLGRADPSEVRRALSATLALSQEVIS